MTSLQLLGATRTVTGSKYLVSSGDARNLVDCGLFQGLKELRLRNWEPLPLDPTSIDAVLLTHAHIDHSGYLPRLIKDGFSGPVYCTRATYDLCRILLPDTGKIQEEDARYANRKGFSKHKPALPLFTEDEARMALRYFEPVPYQDVRQVDSRFSFRFSISGHVLGSAFIELFARGGEKEVSIVFSGDIGRYDRPILNDPEPVLDADYLLVESTYGDRLHGQEDPKAQLEQVILETVSRGGTLVIPAFAVGRTQEILYLLLELKDEGKIPDVPVILDSPMALEATAQYVNHSEEQDREMREKMAWRFKKSAGFIRPVRNHSESLSLAKTGKPAIIVSASGMITGGRVLNHLVKRLPDPKNTVLFVGYQAAGTRGRTILEGAQEVKIHGQMIPIRAQIRALNTLSAHADYKETLLWLRGFRKAPKRNFVVHGEQAASVALQLRIAVTLGWPAEIPTLEQTVQLDG